MLSLFRLIDINIGSIVLNGVDTASIALDSLRKQLAIIPQVSTLSIHGVHRLGGVIECCAQADEPQQKAFVREAVVLRSRLPYHKA
jgi:ABC-type transport system involved in Fe-S cluster assembly fused permease/ATPase subunit